MQKFRVRPEYKSKNLLIEFSGDHRSRGFPNVTDILKSKLNSRRAYRLRDLQKNMFNFNGYTSTWVYKNGIYEIDNDIWSLFVLASKNNETIVHDISSALLSSGYFIKEEVDFSE